MGDMREYFDAMREYKKQKALERNDKYEPLLIAKGAIQKSSSVYMLGDYLCYPTKGFAMHKRSYKKKDLNKFLEELE